MLKKIMMLLLILSSLSFASSATADEFDDLSRVMSNTSNQFVYAFFGRDLLLYYLSESSDIETVKAAREADLVLLSQPFNALSGKLFMMGLTLIYALTLAYFFIRLLMFSIENGWLVQKDGNSDMTLQEKRSMWLKIVFLGGLAIAPIGLKNELVEDKFYTNAATVLLFDALGKAHQLSDESLNELVDTQRQTLQTLVLPGAESKASSAEALNNFYTCVRLDSDRDNSAEHTKEMSFFLGDTGHLEGSLSVAGCYLNVVFGLDVESDKLIEKLNEGEFALGLSESLFKNAQKETFSDLIQELMENAYRYSNELSKSTYSMSWSDGDFSFADHTSSTLAVSELKRWTDRCEQISTWITPEDGIISRKDRVYLNKLSARCQSYIIADKLVYPSSYDELSNYLGNGVKAQKEIALCADQASLNQTLGQSRYVAEYGIGSGDGRSTNIEQISIDACVASYCAESALSEGGMYACTNAISLYDNRLRDLRVKEKGSLMLGFYMFDLFRFHKPSASAKHVFNAFSIKSSVVEKGYSDGLSGETFFKINVVIPELQPHYDEKQDTLIDLMTELEENKLPTIKAPLPVSAITDLLGHTRFNSCVKNPMQIEGGYVCGSVPQEMSRFGVTLLENVITLRTAMIMGQTSNAIGKGFKLTGGSLSGYKDESMLMDAVRLMSSAGSNAILGGASPIGQFFDLASGLKINGVDEFSKANSTVLDEFLGSGVVATFSYLSYLGAENSSLVSFLDTVFFTLMIVAVLFGFLMPAFPLFLIMGYLSKFVYNLFHVLMMHGFKLVDAGFDRDSDLLNDKLDKIWADWLALILRLPLMVIGVVLSWMMSNVIITHVLANMSISFQTNDGVYGLLDLGIIMLVTVVVIFIVFNMVLTVIDSFYTFVVEWVLGAMHNDPFNSEDKAINWKDSKEILSYMGRN